MLIREFFSWAERAGAEARADAAGALAKAYLYAELDPIDMGDASRAMTLLLDDPSPLVRLALAEAFATAVDAPHHILAALACDRSDIASIVLQRSLALSDAELIDAVAVGDDVSQCAVARRASISAALAGAVAEVGGARAVLTLSLNAGADLSDFAVGRMLERFGRDGALREALGRRSDLSAEMRHALVVTAARLLGSFAVGCGWMSADRANRVVGEAQDRATVTIAGSEASGDMDRQRFVSHLRATGHLTPALLLRALLSGSLEMFETILCDLSGKSAARVAGMLRNPRGLSFAALYRTAGLPASLLPLFRAAVAVAIDAQGAATERDLRLDHHIVDRVLAICSAEAGPAVNDLTALLRRFEAEAIRDEARADLDHRLATARTSPRFHDRPRDLLPAIRIAA